MEGVRSSGATWPADKLKGSALPQDRTGPGQLSSVLLAFTSPTAPGEASGVLVLFIEIYSTYSTRLVSGGPWDSMFVHTLK